MENLLDKYKQEGFFPDDYMRHIKFVSTEHQSLRDLFLIPPFSVLDARQGYWQNRKQEWIELGIQSELGRLTNEEEIKDGKVAYSSQKLLNKIQRKTYKSVYGQGQEALNKIQPRERIGTSIFDPVLCEIMYRWFCPVGGSILDPFAGGAVRGIVGALLGYEYFGIELRPEQVQANEIQAQKIGVVPKWIVGDSINIDNLTTEQYDFIFSCPPYYDLEIYSDLCGELSAIPKYEEFLDTYNSIILKSVNLLKNNRFACFVVGDIRNKQGFYRNFVSDTIKAFLDAKIELYNEAILVTATGSLPIRVANYFKTNRKLGKTHQNVLIFYKGEPKKIRTFFRESIERKVEKEEIKKTKYIENIKTKTRWQGLRFDIEAIKSKEIAKLTKPAPKPNIGESGTLFKMERKPIPEHPQRWQGLKFKKGL